MIKHGRAAGTWFAKEMHRLSDLSLSLAVEALRKWTLDDGWAKPLLEVHGLTKCDIHIRSIGSTWEVPGPEHLLFKQQLEDSTCAIAQRESSSPSLDCHVESTATRRFDKFSMRRFCIGER